MSARDAGSTVTSISAAQDAMTNLPVITEEQARSARITAAESAMVGGWLGDLGEVLDMLDLRGAP